MDDAAQLQRMDACFNNYLDRDCPDCGAYRRNGGRCCFGKGFDPNDGECNQCRNEDDCQEEYELVNEPKQEQQRVVITAPSTGARPQIPRPIPRSAPVVTVTVDGDKDELFMRFVKDSVWGALMGMAESMSTFFRTHRWR